MSDRSPSRFTLAAGVALCAVCVVSLTATPAFSQMVCGSHEDIAKRLEAGYSEVPVARGAAHNNGVITLYTSPEGTFTIVLTRPNGMACLMAVGDGWQPVEKVVGTDA